MEFNKEKTKKGSGFTLGLGFLIALALGAIQGLTALGTSNGVIEGLCAGFLYYIAGLLFWIPIAGIFAFFNWASPAIENVFSMHYSWPFLWVSFWGVIVNILITIIVIALIALGLKSR